MDYILTAKSIAYISTLIGLDLDKVDPTYNDWEIELADPAYIEKILVFLPDLEDSDDALAAFAMLISSYDEDIGDNGRNQRLEDSMRAIVVRHPERYKDLLGYWGSVVKWPLDEDYPEEHGLNVTEFARDLFRTAYPPPQ